MKYFNFLNESFDKLNTNKPLLAKKEDLEVMSVDSLYKSLIEQISDEIGDCIVVDNVIYEIVTGGINVSDGQGGTREVDKGVFSVYEFRDNNVYNYETKPSTLEDIEKVGVKPMSYFVKPNPEIHGSIKEFLEWHDYFFGRELFDFEDEEDELIQTVKAIELNMNEELEEPELEKTVYFNEVDGSLVATNDFKDMLINFLKENNPDKDEMSLFSNGFYEMNAYSDESLPLLIKEYNNKWVIYPERMTDRGDYQNSLEYGIDFSFTMYINNKPFDYVSREFVMAFMDKQPEEEQEELNEEDENDDLVLISPEEIKKQIEEEGKNPYEVLGDALFTHYQYLLPKKLSDLYNDIGITGKEFEASVAVKKYIQEKLLKEFKEIATDVTGTIFTYDMSASDIRYNDINVSKEFIRDCFNGDVYEYFNDYSYSDMSAKDYVNQIDEDNLQKLNELGITKEFIKDCAYDNVSEEDLNFDYCEIIKIKIQEAAASAEASGSERQALRYFDGALQRSLPIGVSHSKEDVTINLKKRISINEEFVLYAADYLYEQLSEYNNDLSFALVGVLLTIINEQFYINEPRYGFSGFDKEVFNSTFSDMGIPDIKEKTEEKVKK